MAETQQLTTLMPLITTDDFNFNPFPLPIPPDVLQLQVDTVNVLEGRIAIESFPAEYQSKIINYWRFSAMFQTSKEQNIAKRTTDTLDAI